MADQDLDGTRLQPSAATKEPSGEYHGDAAARVFDIPELLEQILLRLGDDFYIPRKPSPESEEVIHFPIAQLFVVQRVNRTFQNAITGSIKLRRMMFLEAASSTETATQLVWPPVMFWFLHFIGMQANVEDPGFFLLPIMDANDIGPMWKLPADFSTRKDYPSASWQQMKVECSFQGYGGMSVLATIRWGFTDPECEEVPHLFPIFHIESRIHFASLGEIRDWLRFVDLTAEDCQALREKKKDRSLDVYKW